MLMLAENRFPFRRFARRPRRPVRLSDVIEALQRVRALETRVAALLSQQRLTAEDYALLKDVEQHLQRARRLAQRLRQRYKQQ